MIQIKSVFLAPPSEFYFVEFGRVDFWVHATFLLKFIIGGRFGDFLYRCLTIAERFLGSNLAD